MVEELSQGPGTVSVEIQALEIVKDQHQMSPLVTTSNVQVRLLFLFHLDWCLLLSELKGFISITVLKERNNGSLHKHRRPGLFYRLRLS